MQHEEIAGGVDDDGGRGTIFSAPPRVHRLGVNEDNAGCVPRAYGGAGPVITQVNGDLDVVSSVEGTHLYAGGLGMGTRRYLDDIEARRAGSSGANGVRNVPTVYGGELRSSETCGWSAGGVDS